MKTRVSILLLSMLLGLTACTDNSNPVINPEDSEADGTTVFSQEEPDYSSAIIDAPVFISTSLKAEVREGLQTFLTNPTSLADAEVAVVRDEDVGTYDGELLALYQRGGFIVVAQPVGEHYQAFAAKYGLPNVLPSVASQDVLLYATSKKREHYILYTTNPFDPEEIEDPVELSMLEQQAQSYYKRRIFEICRWLNEQRQAASQRVHTGILVESADFLLHNLRIILIFLLNLLHLRRQFLHGLHGLDLLHRQRIKRHLNNNRQ